MAVRPHRARLVYLPARLGRRVEGAAGNARVDESSALRVFDEHPDALAERIDGWREGMGKDHPAGKPEGGVDARVLPELELRGDCLGGEGVVARVASVADGVAVAIGLVGVRDRRAVVERVADTVTVAVGRDLIVGTGGARSGAGFLGIAVTGRGTADERARLEAVRRALADRPVAGLRDVAVARRRAALESGRQDDVGGTVVGGSVAALGDVAGPDRRAADPRALRVRGAVVADAVTALRQIAGAGSGPAAGGALRVGR